MNNKRLSYFCFLVIISFSIATKAHSQNLNYVHKVVRELGQPNMYGRAAINNGDSIAADYIAKEFSRFKLKSFGNDYYQYFTQPAVYQSEVSLQLGKGQILKPEDEFYVLGFSPTYDIEINNEKPIFIDGKEHWELIKKTKLDNIILVFNQKTMPISLKEMAKFIDSDFTQVKPKLVIFQGYEHINYYIGRENVKQVPVIQLVGEPIGKTIDYLKLHIKTTSTLSHKTQNVVGYVEGKNKDKYVLITSHYDALGMFGDKVFPGAQDNASGTAAVLDFASYFAENKPPYSLVFITFGAEEVGMLGSHYFADNPLVPLDKIHLVINLDLVGSGSEGLSIVNGTSQDKFVKQLERINNSEKYFWKILSADNRCNSDHCVFVEKNIPAVFLMTCGQEHKWSHSIYDSYENLPFTKYESLFRLIGDYIKGL
ncbi:MAG: M28 family peptidase [Ignavibacteria bacterium]|nr:M28 family peptidase [Ignavibacteria bacterium]